jgi:hypothetical protein
MRYGTYATEIRIDIYLTDRSMGTTSYADDAVGAGGGGADVGVDPHAVDAAHAAVSTCHRRAARRRRRRTRRHCAGCVPCIH